MPVQRAATLVDPAAPITIAGEGSRFVSRGGDKLDAALERLDVTVAGRLWLDAGASTGGFTDCLLQRGAAAVTALDVGYGQLDWRLRGDPRVHVLERINVRSVDRALLPWAASGVVADLSFISLTLVLPNLVTLAEPGADFVLLVKPQFELDAGSVGKGGVVRDPDLWERAMHRVLDAALELGLEVVGATASQLPGPAGNREFFLHLCRDGGGSPEEAVARAIAEAPA
jgi:23S rRNA (cytidine1920-2'-O)/16S rRNA (cytidine1409-2'-O)-methyltransferase